jgi:hypothetical protein
MAFAENALRPLFSVVVVHVTVVLLDLHRMVFFVAPVMTRRYFDAPLHLRNITFAVRPLKVHLADRNEGVVTTIGVPGDTVGTVTTGDGPPLDSDPPGVALTVVVVATVESEPSSSIVDEVVVDVDDVVDVVAISDASTFKVLDNAELPIPATFAAITAHV